MKIQALILAPAPYKNGFILFAFFHLSVIVIRSLIAIGCCSRYDELSPFARAYNSFLPGLFRTTTDMSLS
jgi:hypothetical protein